jgi:hypothetical protein
MSRDLTPPTRVGNPRIKATIPSIVGWSAGSGCPCCAAGGRRGSRARSPASGAAPPHPTVRSSDLLRSDSRYPSCRTRPTDTGQLLLTLANRASARAQAWCLRTTGARPEREPARTRSRRPQSACQRERCRAGRVWRNGSRNGVGSRHGHPHYCDRRSRHRSRHRRDPVRSLITFPLAVSEEWSVEAGPPANSPWLESGTTPTRAQRAEATHP